MHRAVAVSTLVVGLLAIPVAASAHPAFNPNDLPPGQAVESTLVVPHGCAPGWGMPGDGEAQPTTELAVQMTEGVEIDPMDAEGWQITDDGEAWVWSDDGGATTDVIEFPVMITVDETLAAGEEIYVRAFQECADGSAFQWVGTPDEEAEFPAILLAASEGEVGTAEPSGDMDMNMDHDDMEMDTAEDGEASTTAEDGDTATAAGADETAEEGAAADEETTEDGGDEVAGDDEEAAADSGGLPTPLIVLLAVVLLAVAGFALRARSS